MSDFDDIIQDTNIQVDSDASDPISEMPTGEKYEMDQLEISRGKDNVLLDFFHRFKAVLLIIVPAIACMVMLVLILIIRLAVQKLFVSHSDKLGFLILGDYGREGGYHQKDVAQAMSDFCKRSTCDFVVATGDNIYPAGAATPDDEGFKTSFEDIYLTHSNLKHLKYYTVLGNHDWGTNPDAEIEYANRKNTAWVMPSHYYSHSFMNDKVKMVFLDTTVFLPGTHPIPQDQAKFQAAIKREELDKQKKFLDDELKGDAEWKFVVNHHPLYTAADHADDGEALRKEIEQIFKDHEIDAQLAGHDHNLQHLRRNNIEYLVSGAGSKLRRIVNPRQPQLQWAREVQGFMHVLIQDGEMKVTAVDREGTEIYHYTRTKSSN